MPIPRVVDLSHHNTAVNLKQTADAGIWGVIHKATQGVAYTDPLYAKRRQDVLACGMKWGAYHFNTGDSIAKQVDHFVEAAAPDSQTLMVLDYEDNRLSQMSAAQMVAFLATLEAAIGRKGVIYSGNRLKEQLGNLSLKDRAYVCSHRLWLAQYGPTPHLPNGFASWWLWQYTGDGIGPMPHNVPGIKDSGLDMNAFNGNQEEFMEQWR